MPRLRVEPAGVDGVWRVCLPRWPWQRAAAEVERRALVDRLTAGGPIRRLWLTDADGGHGRWLTLDQAQTVEDAGGRALAYGEWALLFFSREPGRSLGDAPAYPTEPSEAPAVLAALGAEAAIWSYTDDHEWLVAIPVLP